MKDFVILITIIITNVILGVLLKRYASTVHNSNNIHGKLQLNSNNSLIAIVACSFSTLVHSLAFFGVVLAYGFRNWTASWTVLVIVGYITGLLNEIKYAVNIFFLYDLNKKFRDGLTNNYTTN